jgi:superfamily II DNA helicase RecQ
MGHTREALNPVEYALYDKLRNLRKDIADKSGIPVYAVFTNDQLAGMVKKPPKTAKDLLSISGIGESRVKQYGETFIRLFSNEGQTQEEQGQHEKTEQSF